MTDLILKELEVSYPGKVFFTMEEVAQIFGCTKKVVYTWTKRPDKTKRPPILGVGKTLRFPRAALVEWLIEQQQDR